MSETRQVKPRTEGWTQRKDESGKPLLQFSEVKAMASGLGKVAQQLESEL